MTDTHGYPKVRRIRFRFGEKDSAPAKYFAGNDIVMSHFVALLSGSFPQGEEGFIRSVRRNADQIADPTLKKRVAGFIGQESVHGQEHRRVNAHLIEMGYPIAFFDSPKMLDRRLRIERRVGARAHLAATAAAEHSTAVLAEHILTRDEVQALMWDEEIRHLFNWHALEELEHKSVAFDLYRAVGGTERLRIFPMAIAIVLTVPIALVGTLVAVALDPIARRQPIRIAREFLHLVRGPLLKGILRDLTLYLRPGFHPDDIDTRALVEHWQAELFSERGVLVDHLK
jgi:uncharacterized protein